MHKPARSSGRAWMLCGHPWGRVNERVHPGPLPAVPTARVRSRAREPRAGEVRAVWGDVRVARLSRQSGQRALICTHRRVVEAGEYDL